VPRARHHADDALAYHVPCGIWIIICKMAESDILTFRALSWCKEGLLTTPEYNGSR